MLAEYKKYLQSYYNARVLAPADKYLPTLDTPYINLAIISRGRHDRGERDEFALKTLHGGVDQILDSKSPINIEDLLSSGSSGKPVRFILVEGPPGIGKSTFAWELCRRWDEIESLRDYHTLVLLKLREKWVLNATSLSDLFRYPFQPEFSRYVAREVHESHGQNLLLVLDGFDEVSHSFHEDSVIKSILCRQLVPECTIILTTRPSAKATLESVCQPQVDKHVEIIGFTDEERVRYITEVFSKEPELQANFLKYMFLVPHIKSIMYIPLNCAIIAQVYSESQSSRHLAIPRTRTQLYKALTHSLLVRHMKMKEGNREYTSMLPEGLNKEDMDKFRVLAKFAFNTFHTCEPKKVTFFKEDIPERFVHFGFMNESTEMYAGKGVEQTFSFLHLSLQEYLAAWHIAHSYSIEFQVAYHGLAVKSTVLNRFPMHQQSIQPYRGNDREEKDDLLSSLKPLGLSLVEPAIFLAGITGWRCQSEDGRNHWEMYLSHDTAGDSDSRVLLRSLYEAQNPTILSHYFNANSDRRKISIGTFVSWGSHTPYDCYALSYCLAHSSDEFKLNIYVRGDDDVSLVETIVKGLEDHSKPTSPPTVRHLEIIIYTDSVEVSERCLFWLAKAKFSPKSEKIALFPTFLQSLVHLQSLTVYVRHPTSWEWLATLRSLRELKVLRISSDEECSPPPSDLLLWLVEHRLTEVELDIKLPSNSAYCLRSSIDALVGSLLKCVLRSNHITQMVLPNISRETMAGVHSIILHCPSLTSLELKRTRLAYDGILHICRALRNNTTLKHLLIHDDLQVPPSRERKFFNSQFTSLERVALPSKTTCTDFLLELDNVLKTNTTLEEMKIQSGLFLPLSAGEGEEYCQWTGLGPLQQFNVEAVGSGRSPNLRRSFSSSDLTEPQTLLFWDRQFFPKDKVEVDFMKLFSLKKEKGQKLFSLPSFTAPDTEVLQSFSGLDPRLKECLEISVERLTFRGMMGDVSCSVPRAPHYAEFMTPITTLSDVTSDGVKYENAAHDFTLEVPEGAVPETERLTLDVAVALFGPFQFPEGLRPVSPVFWVCVRDQRSFFFSRPVSVTLPHFLDLGSKEDVKSLGLTFLKGSHSKNSERMYEFSKTDGEVDFESSRRFCVLKTSHFCSLCIACTESPECLRMTQFCLTSLLPRSAVSVGRKQPGYFFVTFCNLTTCLTKVNKFIKKKKLGHYEKKHEQFYFKRFTRKPALEMIITQPKHGKIGVSGKKNVSIIMLIVCVTELLIQSKGVSQRSGFLCQEENSSEGDGGKGGRGFLPTTI